jgi:hypothetical protein
MSFGIYMHEDNQLTGTHAGTVGIGVQGRNTHPEFMSGSASMCCMATSSCEGVDHYWYHVSRTIFDVT